MAKFFVCQFYAVFFLKILSCCCQQTRYELENNYAPEEYDEDFSNILVIKPWFELDDNNFDDIFIKDDYSNEEPDIKFNPILSRVRRRIFPGVGKALDRDRSDRNPWVRTRDGYDDQNTETTVLKKNGPMGTDLLYELYPDLAPINWNDASKHGIYEENPLSDDILEEDEEEIKETETKPSFKIERDVGRRNLAQRNKPKVRIPKKLKEEIAIFAEEHGTASAVAYFSDKVNFPLRKNAVEKFVRRYRRRRERQRKRRLSRS